MKTTILLSILACGMSAAFAGSDGAEAKTIFRKRCTACHTFGRGVKVGPDLKGVTERRNREWLERFVASSSAMIESGDRTAAKLFAEFNRERMPDWKNDLTPRQIGAILDWFSNNGPELKEPDERHALTATNAEIEAGRRLFHGTAPLKQGGRACSTCHDIRGAEWSRSGSLGPDLTRVYLKYQDRALTDFLRRPCFPRHPEFSSDGYLTPQETFDLKAYLAKTAGLRIPAPAASSVKNAVSKAVPVSKVKRGAL